MNSTMMLSAALGKALWISHKLLLQAVRAHTQKLLPTLRAVGGHGDSLPHHGLSPWELHSSALKEAFARREVSSSPGSMLCDPSLGEGSCPAGWERPRGLRGSLGRLRKPQANSMGLCGAAGQDGMIPLPGPWQMSLS